MVSLLAFLYDCLLGVDRCFGALKQHIDETKQQRQQDDAGSTAYGLQAGKRCFFGREVTHNQQIAHPFTGCVFHRRRGYTPILPLRDDLLIGFVMEMLVRKMVGPGSEGFGQTILGGIDYRALRQSVPVCIPSEHPHARFPCLPVEMLLADDHGHLEA